MLSNQHVKGTDFFNSIQIFRSENLINNLFMKNSLLRVALFNNPWIVHYKTINGFRRVVAALESEYLKILNCTVVWSLA